MQVAVTPGKDGGDGVESARRTGVPARSGRHRAPPGSRQPGPGRYRIEPRHGLSAGTRQRREIPGGLPPCRDNHNPRRVANPPKARGVWRCGPGLARAGRHSQKTGGKPMSRRNLSLMMSCLALLLLLVPACEMRGTKLVLEGPEMAPEVSAAIGVAARML